MYRSQNSGIPKIVFTGGPCGGKSTVLEILESDLSVERTPEVATMLISGGYPKPGKNGLEWSPLWQDTFQRCVTPSQIQVERLFEALAQKNKSKAVLIDRGILDGGAYTEGGLSAFEEQFGITRENAFARYTAIIHLESTATGDPPFYSQENNDARFEPIEKARELEHRVRGIYCEHPNYHFISCEKGIEGKITEAMRIVRTYI